MLAGVMSPCPIVAVVEDDAGSRNTLKRVLRAAGFDAALYESAEDFLAARLEPATIGLVLDLQLGGMSGLELQERLNAEGSTLPVIVITGIVDPRLERAARQLGCRAFLRKPCEAETIIALLRTLAPDTPSAG
jgi:FixJ family two-component response regulator